MTDVVRDVPTTVDPAPSDAGTDRPAQTVRRRDAAFERWRAEVRRPPSWRSAALLAIVVGGAALVMLLARRSGHWWGDDWALYLRQADGLLHGEPGRVAAENRFTLDASAGPPFSPPVYPWGFPLVLVPFVAMFGRDLDRIALVSTLAACVFACCWYALARPRVGRPAALAGTFAVVTTPLLLVWSELIQSEWTFLAVVGVVLVGLDRLIASGGLIGPGRLLPLVALGVGAAAAFSVRREGFALTPAVAAAQLVALHSDGAIDRWRVRLDPRLLVRLLTPHASALAMVVFLMVALPSTLVPSYDGTSVLNVGRFARQHVEHVVEVAGIKSPWRSPDVLGSAAVGWVAIVVFFAFALGGIVLALTVHVRRDAHFVAYVVVALIIGGSFRSALNRYVASLAPLLVLLGLVALATAVGRLPRHRWRPVILLVPLLLLIAANMTSAIRRIDQSREAAADGRIEWGPTHPDAKAMYDEIRARTPDDAVIGAPKARAMTWATGRLAVQVGTPWRIPTTVELDAIVLEAGDPLRSELDADDAWVATWAGPRFVLYQPPGR